MLSGIVVTFSASWFVENDIIRYSGYIQCKLLKVGL